MLVVGKDVTDQSATQKGPTELYQEVTCKPTYAKIRRLDIDSAKGVAIILVVFGHVVARDVPSGGEWYVAAKEFLYTFHMPLFIFLNGFVFALSWNPDSQIKVQMLLVWNRVSRLLPAFFVMGLIVFIGKCIVENYVPIDNPVHGIASLFDLFVRPTASFSSYLWYLYVLSIIFLSFPLLYRLCGRSLVVLLSLGALLYLFPSSDLFAWVRFRELLVFFVLGVVAAKNISSFDKLIKNTWYFWGALLICIWFTGNESKLVCGALAIPFVMGLVKLKWFERDGVFEWIGRYTLPIYLFNTIFIGLSKVIVSRFLIWNEHTFFTFFIILFFSGVFAPIFLKSFLLKKIPLLDKYT